MTEHVDVDVVTTRMNELLLTQEELAARAKVSGNTVFRMLSGKPIQGTNLRLIAAALGVDPQVIRRMPSRSEPDHLTLGAMPPYETAAPQEVASIDAGGHSRHGEDATVEALHDAATTASLIELLGGRLTVVTGDRRRWPPTSPTDVLLPVGWTDFAGLAALRGAATREVVSDVWIAEDRLREDGPSGRFDGPLLSVGAADVNFLTLLLNPHSVFRFVVDEVARNRLVGIFAELHSLPTRREQSKRFFELQGELVELRRGLSPHAFFDPLSERDDDYVRGHPCGLISLTGHYSRSSVLCLLAAGVTGPTTAGALAILSGRAIADPWASGSRPFSDLRSRPAGGIFRRTPSRRSPPDDILHVADDLEWVTPPYDLELLLHRLGRIASATRAHPHMKKEDAGRLVEIVERLRRGSAPNVTTGLFSALLPSGGKGTRMNEFTRNQISKLDLPVGGRSVLEWVLTSLEESGLVSTVDLLSTVPFVEAQRGVARRWTRGRFSVAVYQQETENWFQAAADRAMEHLRLGRWLVIMMPDVLIPPGVLRRVLSTAVSDGSIACAVSCTVDISTAPRYGVVQLKNGPLLSRILEKPGEATEAEASLGFYAFSPSAASLVATYRNQHGATLVGLVNFLCENVAVRSYHIDACTHDCGSPQGYVAACAQADQIGALWQVEKVGGER
jgi:dTDP-glucose pyrophosphorylase